MGGQPGLSTTAPARPRTATAAPTTPAAAAGLYVLIVLMSLLQQPGRITYDTRAELTERPLDFLRTAFTLWHPESNFGELQNQAYGYLFPQGSWFALGDLVHAPDWIWQRLWSALVLIVAIEGARRVAAAVGLTPPAALLAGLAFGFSPRLLGTVSVITGESLPGAVMPWVILPILLALNGRLDHRRAVILSAAAVVCMGGVNAVENAGSLPLAVILVGWGVRRGLAPLQFAVEWSVAVLLAATWWVLPLLVLSRYAPPFYEYVESAANTTSLIGWSEATRGDSHWVAYLITGDQAWWPAANDLVSVPWLIVVSALVSAIGLWGLTRFEHPLRRPLVLGMVVGLAALTIAHGGWEGSPVAGGMRSLLDGPLQIFRNVHKIDPIVRLPLAIGFGRAVVVGARAALVRWPRLAGSSSLFFLVPAALVLSLGQPYLVNHTRTAGWDTISTPWRQARDYLAGHADGRTTLVLPGSGFAQQTWGWTLDEPLLVLGGVDVVTRSQVPIIPGQSIRFLASLDQLAVTGRATPALADQLARAGIGHVVIRRDLLRALTASPHPGGAAVSMANGGLRPVAAFGTGREGGAEIEVLEVPGGLPTLRSTPIDDVVTVGGAPESVLDLQQEGLVAPGIATVLDGEPGWRAPVDVVTDGDQRRERAFGANDEAVSTVLGADDPWRIDRATHDYPTVPRDQEGAEDRGQVVATYDGLSGLTASSSQGYADNFGPVAPQAGPYAAIDGDRQTRWVTSPATDPRQQWLRLDLAAPRGVHEVRVLPVVDDGQVLPIRSLEVVAGDQVRRVETSPSGAPSVVVFDGREVDRVEVRITGVGTRSDHGRVGLREVTVDGLTPTRSLAVPRAVPEGGAFIFDTAGERRACMFTLGAPDCQAARIRSGEEPAGLSRTFSTADDAEVGLRGLVVARSTREAARLLDPLALRRSGATSVYGNDPKVASRFAYDGELSTSWISADEDTDPTLLFTLARRQVVRGIIVHGGIDAPVEAVVRAGHHVRKVRLVPGVRSDFKPLRGRELSVTFEEAPGSRRVEVAEVALTGVRLARPFYADTPTGAVCGLGPNLEIDGRLIATRVRGTMADVVNGTPLRFQACDAVELPAGEHRLSAPPTAEFQVVEVVGQVLASTHTGTSVRTGSARAVRVDRWTSSERTADLGAGGESLLHLPENFNDGWVAEIDGTPLQALRVDGWQQAWVLPAATADVQVEISYRPQRVYDVVLPIGLTVSGLVLLAGLTLLLVGLRRRPRTIDAVGWGPVPPQPARRWRVLVGAMTVVALGPVCLAGVLAAVAAGSRRGVQLASAAAGLLVLSGVVDGARGPDWTRSAGDAAAAIAVGLVVGATLLGAPPGRRRAERGAP